jgi:ABC-2 type transport system ATP-binding protein
MHGTQNKDVAVEVRDLTVGYQKGKPVLEGISANFHEGALVLVRGKNGSGKSTLLEVCSGYLPPWQGTVTINGLHAGSASARTTRRVCRTQQALYPNMSVRDHLVFASRCMHSDPADALARAARYGLEPWLDYDAKALSTGNSRKLWIVMCTLGSFNVVLLDEPFNGLDDDGVDVLREDIKKWATEKAVLLISHAPPPGLAPDETFIMGPTDDE